MGSRRTIELLLLSAAAPAVLLIFALTAGANRAVLTAADFVAPGGLLLAFAAAHLAARRFAPGADPALLPIAALLSGIGLAVVTRLDPALAASQTLWLLGGVALLAATLAFLPPLERLARYKYTIMITGLVLLLLPAVIGREVNGAKLWLRFAGFSFQPAEIAKLLIVLFLAAYLAENREVLSVAPKRLFGLRMPPARHLGPLLLMWAVSLVVLVAEKDLGSSLLFFGVFLVMITVATGRWGYAVIGTLLFGAGATAAYFAFTHVRTRVGIWIDPFADAAGKGYQLVQSLFALAAGGVIGVGPGRGMPDRIPFVATDFIFSAIGEELGLLGGAAVIAAYLVLCLRGLATAVRARSDMAALTAAGLVATIGLQSFVIVGGVTRLIPLTGITLPFVSYGGSSVVSNFILLALLMRAGDDAPAEGAELVTTGQTGTLGRLALAGRLTGEAWMCIVLTVALITNLAWIQVGQAQALSNNTHNTRGLEKELRAERGAILTKDGAVLARSVVQPDGRYRRTYPSGTLAAHVTGYYSAQYGRAGMEAAANTTLAGHRGFASFTDVMDDALGRPVAGNDVVLTIDSRIQKAAEKALAGRRGAVVAIDPRTGAVLAIASSPGFSPAKVDAQLKAWSKESEAPLVDRALSSVYPPGSTFKVVTLTRTISSGIAGPDTVLPAPSVLQIGGGKVTNFEGVGYGSATLRQATRSSINTVYAQLADRMGATSLVDQARAFGFDRSVPFELSAQPSIMPAPENMTKWETAWAGVGQPVGANLVKGPVATPLQMALVAAGIANGGRVMQPYVIDHTADPSGRPLATTTPRLLSTACDAATAATVRDLMVDVVKTGSGKRAAIRGVDVAGKTGTAEVGRGVATHAWFIAFAPADAPTIALAIVLENGGVGGRVAAAAARGILDAGLRR
ncbi:MAG: FtsW/RodA/SpoVE family cell cycle protein [Coriobacteriia bacterium]|nr:FtsW/RodA/SpoVE family cell cycle protein [Coriobacteriia bacterium]